MGWRDNRQLTYMNRGFETQVSMKKIHELPGQFRVQVFERLVGGQPTQTHESVSFEEEAHQAFNHYVEQAMNSEYTPTGPNDHPNLKDTNPTSHAAVVGAGMGEAPPIPTMKEMRK
jgi:hypothetical protein